jgi:hypothetical protein
MATSIRYYDCASAKERTFPAATAPELDLFRYLPSSWACDGYVDCDDWEDEDYDASTCTRSIVLVYYMYLLLYAFLSAVCLIAMIVVFKYRSHPIMRFSSWRFLCAVLFGCLGGYSSLFFFIGVPTNYKCRFRAWVLGIAFVFGFGALFARTYRIQRIFASNAKLRRAPKVADTDLAKIVAYLLVIEMVIFSVWAGLGNWNAVRASDGHMVCDAPYMDIFLGVLFGYKALMMLWGAGLAFLTRNVYREFNESKYLLAAIVAWLILALVGLPILFTDVVTGGDPINTFVVRHLLVALGISVVVVLLFGPKFYVLWRMHRDPAYARRMTTMDDDVATRSATSRRSNRDFDFLKRDDPHAASTTTTSTTTTGGSYGTAANTKDANGGTEMVDMQQPKGSSVALVPFPPRPPHPPPSHSSNPSRGYRSSTVSSTPSQTRSHASKSRYEEEDHDDVLGEHVDSESYSTEEVGTSSAVDVDFDSEADDHDMDDDDEVDDVDLPPPPSIPPPRPPPRPPHSNSNVPFHSSTSPSHNSSLDRTALPSLSGLPLPTPPRPPPAVASSYRSPSHVRKS